MKKAISLLLFFILIISSTNVAATDNTFDENPTVNLDISPTSVITWLSSIFNLGDFVGVDENSPLKIIMTLDYDSVLIESIKVRTLDGWTASIAEDSKSITLETNSATPNTEIATIFYYLRAGQGERPGFTYITIGDITISNGTTLNETHEDVLLSYRYSGDFAKPSGEDSNDKDNNTLPTNTNNTILISNNQNGQNNYSNVDNTVANSKLPNAGFKNFLILSILILIVCIVVFKIKSKDLKY